LFAHGVDPARAAMFEDIAKNLLVPKAKGMTTILVTAKPGQADHRQAEDREPTLGAAADFVTDDLVGFLRGVNEAIGA